tara:strand:+ start:1595 stop:2086 length:492 start_codon:yes stop_codon:yes gene_type:complete
MLLKSNSSHNSVKRYLKEEFSIGSKFVSLNKDIKRNISPIELKGSMLVSDLINFYDLQGVQVNLYNSDGISIPRRLTLERAREFNLERSKDSDFESLISSLISMSNTSDYSDIEWIKRIFKRAIKKIPTPEDVEILKDLLAKVYSNNDKFLSSDFDEISELFP